MRVPVSDYTAETPCLVIGEDGTITGPLDLLEALAVAHHSGPGHAVVRCADGAVLQVETSYERVDRALYPSARWCEPWAWRWHDPAK